MLKNISQNSVQELCDFYYMPLLRPSQIKLNNAAQDIKVLFEISK